MRRRARSTVAAALAATLLFGAAACGDDDGDAGGGQAVTTAPGGESPVTTGARNDAATDVDPDGVLRLYWDLMSAGGPDLDPSKVRVSPATMIQIMLYDSLLRLKADGTYEPGLAESAEVVDPQTIHIVLREGVTFTDGTPLDAEAVKFSIERNRDADNVTLSAELQEISDITVESPTELTLHLASPIAGAVYDLLAWGDFLVVSPTAARAGNDFSTNPVGAGPFMLDRLEPGRLYRYKKNPDYFEADRVRVAAVEWHHIDPGQARTNAIQAGEVDVASQLFSYEQSKAIANTGWEISAQVTDNTMMWGQWCKSRPPFDDVRVRQAVSYAVDRDAVNAAIYDGKGEPQWGFFVKDHPLHNPAVDGMYDYDPEKAKQLLAEAGAEGLTFDAYYGAASQRAAEVMQASMAEAGITMNIKMLTNSADFFPDAKGAPLYIFPLERTGIQKVARTIVPGSVGNVCQWDDARLNELVDQIKAVRSDSAEAKELWADLQQHTLETAASLFGVFGVAVTGYDGERLGDVDWLLNFQGRPEIDIYDVYVKQRS